MNERTDALAMLAHIDPKRLDYGQWCAVGMALHSAGCSADDWERWSGRDAERYKPGECSRKWKTFRNDAGGVGTGTLAHLCREHGGALPVHDRAFEWDKPIPEAGVVLAARVDLPIEVTDPGDAWDPVDDCIRFLSALYSTDEHVAYTVTSFEREGRPLPGKCLYDRTAGALIEALTKHRSMELVFGDYNPAAGGWVKLNPMDGKGYSDANVVDYKYALVESDTLPIDRQMAILSTLELPAATIVHSGGKSLHAAVHIGAASEKEYRERVQYLYDVCRKNGMEVDRQNCNPSRLSRLPGLLRNGGRQYLVAVNAGKRDWNEWREWIEEQSDTLPEVQSMVDVWDDMPPLSEPLIDGLLRRRHKMGISGPSKAGKSYLLISLAIAIAEGRTWLGHYKCTQGRVLLVNLEIDPASCLHRVREVYEGLDWSPDNIKDLDIWNLRGAALPMEKLAGPLIRRAQRRKYAAIIIDPIYKVMTGDENSAEQMARFFNNFDRVCRDLDTAIIYCHHHSKGAQGQKRSQDRASGSGVFARDPDAVIDLIELEIGENRAKHIASRARCLAITGLLDRWDEGWRELAGQDDLLSPAALLGIARKLHPGAGEDAPYLAIMSEAHENAGRMSAWRLEATLREFKPPAPVRMFFDFPIHRVDADGLLDGAVADGEETTGGGYRQKAIKDKRETGIQETLLAYSSAERDENGMVSVASIAQWIGITERAARTRIKAAGLSNRGGYVFENGKDGDQ